MTYDLEQVKAAVLAVDSESDFAWANGRSCLVVDHAILVWTDGDMDVDLLINKSIRPIVRSIIDDLDRQDAAREGAQT